MARILRAYKDFFPLRKARMAIPGLELASCLELHLAWKLIIVFRRGV